MKDLRDLTFICAYYLNRGMLLEQQRVWSAYPPELKTHFHAIVTDDLSPSGPAVDVFAPTGIASQRLYTALEHRRFDWLFCRNLGASVATTEWLLLTDIDHVLPAETLLTILTKKLHASNVYRFGRVDAHHGYPWAAGSLTEYKPHPNSWLLTKKMFDRIGGYDERFSGWYGSDSEFRERVHATADRVEMKEHWPLVRYPREIIPDASTTTYQRKTAADGENVPRIKAERAQIRDADGREAWKPLRLTIPYRLEATL